MDICTIFTQLFMQLCLFTQLFSKALLIYFCKSDLLFHMFIFLLLCFHVLNMLAALFWSFVSIKKKVTLTVIKFH